MASISRQAYAEMFGPTVGDRLRLADTGLVIEIEKDHTLYGEEVKFGGGKTITGNMDNGGVSLGKFSSKVSADIQSKIEKYADMIKSDSFITDDEVDAVKNTL